MNTLEEHRYYLTTYAQNREDLIVLAIFGEDYKGFYIDVGSNHPIHHSVTKLLYKNGWRGINIDPNVELMTLTSYDRPDDIQVNCGIGQSADTQIFRQYANHGLSTFSGAMKGSYEGSQSAFTDKYTDYKVTIRTLKDICEEYSVTEISLLKVDVEGFEAEVLKGNDWNKFRPNVICIESNHKESDWGEFLDKQGYKKFSTDNLNDYYADTNADVLDKAMQFDETVLKYPHIVDNDVAGYIDVLEKRQAITRLGGAHIDDVHVPTMASMKSNVRNALNELKHLAKQRRAPADYTFEPTSPIPEVPSGPSANLTAYIKQMNILYAEASTAYLEHIGAQQPMNRAQRLALKARLIAYDMPAVLASGARQTIKRRRS